MFSLNKNENIRDRTRLMMADKDSKIFGHITPVQQMISSCSGAILTSVFVTPLDVVKIRLQTQQKPLVKGQCYVYCNGLMDHLCTCLNGNGSGTVSTKQWFNKKVPKPFTGPVDAFLKIYKFEGLSSLWSGLPPTLVMAVPATVVYFTTYEQIKLLLGYREGVTTANWFLPVVAGATARTGAVIFISPLEMIRTKMQSEQLSYTQLRKAIKKTYAQGGLRAMYKGLGPTLLRDVPFSALYWVGYESMKTRVLRTRGTTAMNFTESFTSGAVAGTIAGVITLPFDVIKTHRQIELGQALQGNKSPSSTWILISQLYKQQGIKSLFTGLVPRVVKVAPACAIMISSYEYFKSFFRTRNERKRLEMG